MEMGDSKETKTRSEETVAAVPSFQDITSETRSTKTGSSTKEEDEVRTLFVSGLPMDASARELYLLCRACKGYVDSRLNNARNKYGKPLAPIGFVTFSSRDEATAAMEELQNVPFDPSLSGTIRLEFAKSNSKGTKSLHPQLKRTNVQQQQVPVRPGNAAVFRNTSLADSITASTFFPATPMILPSQRPCYPYAAQYEPNYSLPFLQQESEHGQTLSFGDTINNPYASCNLNGPSLPFVNSPLAVPSTISAPTLTGYTPSSTLFVANLNPFVTERELTEVFGPSPGFLSVRLYTKGASPVAFIKYADPRFATQAMTVFQGYVLRYSDRGGIRIEYAKSKMDDEDDSNKSSGGWTPLLNPTPNPWSDGSDNWTMFNPTECL